MRNLVSAFVSKASKFLKNIEMPHKSVMVLAAICISAIAISLSYKIKEASMQVAGAQYSANIAVEAGTSEQALAADKRIAAALAETQADILGSLATSTNPFDPSPKDSMSDTFTKNIVTAYAKYQYAGNGGADLSALSDEALSNLRADTLPQKKYAITDVIMFVPKSDAEIKEYGNAFAKNYLTALVPVMNSPAKYDADINAVSGIYRQISANLIKMRVPSEVAVTHLQVVNDFTLMADTFPLINGQEKDPVKALLGLSLIQDSMTEVPQLFVQIHKYFKQNGIIFDKNEPGSIWDQVPDSISEAVSKSI